MALLPGLVWEKVRGKGFAWSVPAQIPCAAGLAGVLAGSDHDCVLIAGGTNFPEGMPWEGGKKKYYDEIYVLVRSLARGSYEWVVLNDQRLPEPMAYSACVTTPQGVVCVGGENEFGPSRKVWRMRWDEFSKNVVVQRLADLPMALSNAAAVWMNGHVYVAGGEMPGGVSDRFCRLTDDGWEDLPALPKVLSHIVLIGIEGRIFLVGGRRKKPDGISELSASVYCYEIERHRWVERQPLPYPLSAGTGIVDRGRVYMFGGDRGEVFHQTEELIVAIAAEKDAARKEALVLEKETVQRTHPGFSKEVLMYDVGQDRWTAEGAIPFPSPVTTVAFLWQDKIVIPGGEIRAGVRTSQILLAEAVATT